MDNLEKLTENLHEPAYVYDLNHVHERLQLLKSVLPKNAGIQYAMKANFNPVLLTHLKTWGAGVDVVSGGELLRALQCGFKPSDIVFSGVGKSKQEIRLALEKNIFQANVESLEELQRWHELSRETKTSVNIAIRINPNIRVETHPYIATGLKEDKFGLDISQLSEASRLLKQNQFLRWVGLSVHIGSQIQDLSPFEEAFRSLYEQMQIYQKSGFEFSTVDIGGGLGINYESSDLKAEEDFCRSYGELIKKYFTGANIQLLCEPGRFLVARAGVLLAQCEYVKKTPHKTFLVLNTGMHHLLRPALYEAKHRILSVKKSSQTLTQKYDVVGPICESSDFFAKDVELPVLKEGDWVAIQDTGAYGFAMASHYNLHALPKEFCFIDGQMCTT